VWLLPVAVARTLENVPYEHENLPRFIEKLRVGAEVKM
jgi:hypothetical protein